MTEPSKVVAISEFNTLPKIQLNIRQQASLHVDPRTCVYTMSLYARNMHAYHVFYSSLHGKYCSEGSHCFHFCCL